MCVKTNDDRNHGYKQSLVTLSIVSTYISIAKSNTLAVSWCNIQLSVLNLTNIRVDCAKTIITVPVTVTVEGSWKKANITQVLRTPFLVPMALFVVIPLVAKSEITLREIPLCL